MEKATSIPAVPALNACGAILVESLAPGFKLASRNRLTHLAHEVQIKVKVMDSREVGAKNFLDFLQVIQVAARECWPVISMVSGIADRAVAGGIDRPEIIPVAGIADLQIAKTRE